MLHAFVGVAMLNLIPKIFHLDDAWKFWLCLPALILTTAISVLSFHFFEAPTRRYFSSFGMRRRVIAAPVAASD
jgi:peptidoglycan/LPS O-acetylase OafA/YrhL